MTKYQILLPDNRTLSNFNDFMNASFLVWDEIDCYLDTSTGDNRATSWLINDNDDIATATIISAELLTIVLGIFRLRQEKYISQSIVQEGIVLSKNNSKVNKLPLNEVNIPNFTLSKIWKERLAQKPYNKKEIDNLKSNIFDALIYLAAQEEDVYIILKLFAENITWLSLCMIYETIEEFGKIKKYPNMITVKIKGKDKQILDEKNNSDKLTKPANCFSITGFSSRHGYRHEVKSIDTTDCFDIDEATEYVIKHAKNYINWKLKNFHNSELFNKN